MLRAKRHTHHVWFKKNKEKGSFGQASHGRSLARATKGTEKRRRTAEIFFPTYAYVQEPCIYQQIGTYCKQDIGLAIKHQPKETTLGVNRLSSINNKRERWKYREHKFGSKSASIEGRNYLTTKQERSGQGHILRNNIKQSFSRLVEKQERSGKGRYTLRNTNKQSFSRFVGKNNSVYTLFIG